MSSLAVLAVSALLLGGCSTVLEPLKGQASRGPVAEMRVDQAQASALVSDYRRAHGLGSVETDPALQRVAQAQADAMAGANQLSHTVDGAMPDRLARFGVTRATSVENVSAGYADMAAALGGWRRSPAHNKNLLYRPMRRIGVAAAEAPGTRYKHFWALVMTN